MQNPVRRKKSRGIAVVLAVLLGGFGVHKFYLRDPGAGIFYIILNVMTLRMFGFGIATALGWFDAFHMLTMGDTAFDRKYNWNHMRKNYSDVSKHRPSSRRYRTVQRKRREEIRKKPRTRTTNAFIKTGIKKFKDFDLEGAVEDFEKAVEISPKNADLHFNMACVYSLLEQTEKSFHHLEQSVALGLKNKELIHGHDALAYLRIQPAFEKFVENGYKMDAGKMSTSDQPKEDVMQQLGKLQELKDKGLISEIEFIREKQKLSART